MQFLKENATDTIVCAKLFLIADEQTTLDKTLLLVNVIGSDAEDGEEPEIFKVHIAAELANVEAVCISVAVTDGGALQDLVDENGIYRGGPDRHTPQRWEGMRLQSKSKWSTGTV